MAREVVLLTPEQVEIKLELAGIGSRFVALLIDSLWQALMFIILGLTIWGIGAIPRIENIESMGIWLFALLLIVIFVITNGYFLLFETTQNGQTPGKKAAGIRVIRDTGHPVDFRSALLRNLMRIVDSLPGMYAVGIVSVFFSSQYRRLGDYVGGTLVVKVGRKPTQPITASESYQDDLSDSDSKSIPEAFSYTLPAESMPYIADIAKDDYRAIRHFLDRRTQLTDSVVADLARQIAEPIAEKLHLEINQIDDLEDFLHTVGNEWEKRKLH